MKEKESFINTSQISINDSEIVKNDIDDVDLEYVIIKFNLFSKSLVSHGAYLFVENQDRSTPCDLAERFGNKDIALYLESKMIFSVS